MREFNITKKDVFNVASSMSLAKKKGEVIKVEGVAITKTTSIEDSSKEIEIGIIKTVDGNLLSTVSPSAIQVLNSVIDYLEQSGEDKAELRIEERTSGSGRNYITLILL